MKMSEDIAMDTDRLSETLQLMGRKARAAAGELACATTHQKNGALLAVARDLQSAVPAILAANALDVSRAESHELSAAMVDRLRLTPERIEKMADEVRNVSDLPDPVGTTLNRWRRPNGMEITKVRVPIGVVGIIYESRPNVTCDAAVLCLKTGNTCILRGGSEAVESNRAIAEVIRKSIASCGLPADAVQLVSSTDRSAVALLAKMDRYIDMIVPRGGHALIEAVVENARMPVIKHYHGVCHVYLDETADSKMAEAIVVNAKCQRPGTCNAAETLLVHQAVADALLPKIGEALSQNGVELRGDEATRKILGATCHEATEADWWEEYLDLILSIKIVADMDEAIRHINHYGSHHSDAIITRDEHAAERFLREVDSAAVYWNASTRFTDGGEFGFGAEIGISTDKLHARGPMGLEELTTYKYTVRGEGQVRE